MVWFEGDLGFMGVTIVVVIPDATGAERARRSAIVPKTNGMGNLRICNAYGVDTP